MRSRTRRAGATISSDAVSLVLCRRPVVTAVGEVAITTHSPGERDAHGGRIALACRGDCYLPPGPRHEIPV